MSPMPKLHLYHGLRHLSDLPYRQQLGTLEGKGTSLTLVLSSKGNDRDDTFKLALERGFQLSALAAEETSFVSQFMKISKKTYVQHVVGMDLAAGSLKRAGVSVKSTAVIICGRAELLREVPLVLESLCHDQGFECEDFLARR